MASGGLSLLLALEVALTGRATADRDGPPRLDPTDGRVVSNFLWQALHGDPLTIYGDGSQTRSFCFVDDEVRGILSLADSDEAGLRNVGKIITGLVVKPARRKKRG